MFNKKHLLSRRSIEFLDNQQFNNDYKCTENLIEVTSVKIMKIFILFLK